MNTELIDITPQQKEFLRLHIICGKSFNEISQELVVPRSVLTTWYEDLRTERERIARIRIGWGRKKFTATFEPFYNWYELLEKKCAYCDITEDQIAELLESGKLTTKRIATRGK